VHFPTGALITNIVASVADLGCLSRIPYPNFHPSRILDPRTAAKERGGKNYLSHLFCGHKFHIIENYLIFEMLKKKIWANFQRITELFTQTIVTKLSKIWVWDPGSEIRDAVSGKNLFWIPDPGVKKASDPGSGSATLIVGSLF
jgi:hypothetical protein